MTENQEGALNIWMDREGKLLRLRLARPKANIIDAEMIFGLNKAFDDHSHDTNLMAVLIDSEGPHFSFGASVEEHLPAHCAVMLETLHHLIGTMLDYPVPILTAVRGQCLGAGLELAMAGGPIFAAPDTVLGQPEIKLAVMAPSATCLLPERVGQGHAEDILFSGRNIGSEEAVVMGLVNRIAEDPEAEALTYFDEQLAGLSASSLRFAVKAARGSLAARVKAKLAEVEELYLSGLMATKDPVEGLQAFLDKRPAKWENR